MIVKNATQLGNPIIRRRSKEVGKLTPAVRKTITDLRDSMRHHSLVGMAAPQIGKNVRIFVTEIRKTKDRDPKILDAFRVYINPHIIWESSKTNGLMQGCGSVASSGLFGLVRRPSAVTVRATDETGAEFELSAKGLLSHVIQHELDHLDGIVFTDRANPASFMTASEYRKARAKKKRQDKRK